MPALQPMLDEITQKTLKLVQPERLAISEDAVAELFASGIEDRVLPVGATAPDLALPDATTGRLVRSADLLALGPLIVTFFRGRWDPYCATEQELWRDLMPRVREAHRRRYVKAYLFRSNTASAIPCCRTQTARGPRSSGLLTPFPKPCSSITARFLSTCPSSTAAKT